MGSGDTALKAAWAPDMQYLLDLNIPCILTCANDYMDVPGEMEIMQREKARFLLDPCRNPFAAMSTYRPEDNPSEETQANAYVYVVMGRTGCSGAPSTPMADTAALECSHVGVLRSADASPIGQDAVDPLSTIPKHSQEESSPNNTHNLDQRRHQNDRRIPRDDRTQENAASHRSCERGCELKELKIENGLSHMSCTSTAGAKVSCADENAGAVCSVIQVDRPGHRIYFFELQEKIAAPAIKVRLAAFVLVSCNCVLQLPTCIQRLVMFTPSHAMPH